VLAMKKNLSLILFICIAFNSSLFSQSSKNEIASKQEVKNGYRTTYKSGASSVTDFLNSAAIREIEKIQSRKGVFKLLMDNQGSVTAVTLVYGGITSPIDNQLISSFFKMPAWTTNVSENQLAIVYVVVTIKGGKLSTELY
jgi:hypothetical protein